MVNFESGQNRLTQPAVKGGSVIFNDPARARWVRFAKSLFFAARAGVVKPRQPLCGLVLSDTIFRIFESTAVAGSGDLTLLLGLPRVKFARRTAMLAIESSEI
jgi:hypothetical protein